MFKIDLEAQKFEEIVPYVEAHIAEATVEELDAAMDVLCARIDANNADIKDLRDHETFNVCGHSPKISAKITELYKQNEVCRKAGHIVSEKLCELKKTSQPGEDN